MANVKKIKGVIGILTGGGDVPGLNPAIRAVTIRALREGYQVIGLRRGWAGLIELCPRSKARQQQQLPDPDRRNRQQGRAHRRHLPAYLPHQAQPMSAKTDVPDHLARSTTIKMKNDLTPEVIEEPGFPGHRLPDPHRRR